MRDPVPFSKWDPDGGEARRRQAARHLIEGDTPAEATRKAQAKAGRRPDPLAGKRWILRWASLISTGVVVLGWIIGITILTGHGHWLGL